MKLLIIITDSPHLVKHIAKQHRILPAKLWNKQRHKLPNKYTLDKNRAFGL